MMIKFLIEKEFKQLFRNSFLPRMILMFPIMMMVLMPWAANMEIRNLNLCVIDNDHSMLSQRLVNRIEASTYFKLTANKGTYAEGMNEIEAGRADLLLELPPHLERHVTRGEPAQVLIAANSVNGTKGGLGSSYLASIVRGNTDSMVSVRNLYNLHQDYKLFMVPGLMGILLTLLCGFLPALNVVSEKEVGTIDQINVTPVNKFVFILAKLIPYWVVGFVVLSICFVLAWAIYGFVPVGSLLVIYAGAAIYVLAMSGLGLVISNHSSTMQQAMFVMWFCLVVFILMSGLFTPIRSMPQWAEYITMANPLKYFVEVMRMVFIKGSSWSDLSLQFASLGVFALALNAWAVVSYRKSA